MAFKSKNIIVKIDGVRLFGIRSKTMSINRDPVDVTNESDEDANGDLWRNILAETGMMVLSLSGAGIFKDDAAVNVVENLVFNGDSAELTLEFENGDSITGTFQVVSFEHMGEHFGLQQYSIALESVVSGGTTPNLTRA